MDESQTVGESFLILHGTGGNKPDHWQEHLVRELREAGADVHYPQMPRPDDPELGPWLKTLRSTLKSITRDRQLTVLTHSRGCLLWMHYAASGDYRGPKADRVLLVAPPYSPPTGRSGWFPMPLEAAKIAAVSRETTIIASDDDEFATFEDAQEYATALSVPIYLLSGSGHISPYYGYGPWPWVREWCLRQADFPPLPNRIAEEIP